MASRRRGSAALTVVVAKTATCPDCWTSSSAAWSAISTWSTVPSSSSRPATKPTSPPPTPEPASTMTGYQPGSAQAPSDGTGTGPDPGPDPGPGTGTGPGPGPGTGTGPGPSPGTGTGPSPGPGTGGRPEPAADPRGQGADWQARARTARLLSWASLAWMAAEGAAGLIAGAKAGSVSLTGWAVGSVIEGLASVIVIWRFTGSRALSPTSEQRARKAVAVSFFLLAPYLAAESTRDLLSGHRPQASTLGIAVTAASLVLMPLLGIAKQRLGKQLDSRATTGEGTQNLLCAAQAAAVLLGLATVAAFGWWWTDSLIALGLAAVAVREGRQAWHGDDCC